MSTTLYTRTTLYTFSARSSDGDTAVLTSEAVSWVDLAETYYKFLIASGFVLSRSDLADYYTEMGDLNDAVSNDNESTETVCPTCSGGCTCP